MECFVTIVYVHTHQVMLLFFLFFPPSSPDIKKSAKYVSPASK